MNYLLKSIEYRSEKHEKAVLDEHSSQKYGKAA
jgi:hypothetical protein